MVIHERELLRRAIGVTVPARDIGGPEQYQRIAADIERSHEGYKQLEEQLSEARNLVAAREIELREARDKIDELAAQLREVQDGLPDQLLGLLRSMLNEWGGK